MEPANGVTCGIDWASDDHAVSIVETRLYHISEILRCRRSSTAMPDCVAYLSLLTKHGVGEVAIERPDGPVIDALLDRWPDRRRRRPQPG